MDKGLWQDWGNVGLGLWLFMSPFAGVGSGEPAAVWNANLSGLAITLAALAAVAEPKRWEERFNLLIGVWLVVAPFVLGYSGQTGAAWNHIIVGVLVAADAVWAMRTAFNPPHAHI